ncbi:MAG: PIG-L family deacetylase [Oligoflexia bacterium]|nr:PIG-L family deacetylase [Oligoflexia bacterium]
MFVGNNILVIAPHMDDEILGCGGTIAKYVRNGKEVNVIFCANRVYDRVFDEKKFEEEKNSCLEAKKVINYNKAVFLDLPDERLDTLGVQKLLIPLEKEVVNFKPEIVLLPHFGDLHQDHRFVHHSALISCRFLSNPTIKALISYEVISSTEQISSKEHYFIPNWYEDITLELDYKLTAMKCYERESRQYPHPRSIEGIKVRAQIRGVECGVNYAEAFCLLKGRM